VITRFQPEKTIKKAAKTKVFRPVWRHPCPIGSSGTDLILTIIGRINRYDPSDIAVDDMKLSLIRPRRKREFLRRTTFPERCASAAPRR